mmetsp:Transcript_8660/g.18905  ORF Transcript_8660/g.18905 Transcript_8660/m.18905 type:complete len:216 (+) Transcript_8660:90-737(+)
MALCRYWLRSCLHDGGSDEAPAPGIPQICDWVRPPLAPLRGRRRAAGLCRDRPPVAQPLNPPRQHAHHCEGLEGCAGRSHLAAPEVEIVQGIADDDQWCVGGLEDIALGDVADRSTDLYRCLGLARQFRSVLNKQRLWCRVFFLCAIGLLHDLSLHCSRQLRHTGWKTDFRSCESKVWVDVRPDLLRDRRGDDLRAFQCDSSNLYREHPGCCEVE